MKSDDELINSSRILLTFSIVTLLREDRLFNEFFSTKNFFNMKSLCDVVTHLNNDDYEECKIIFTQARVSNIFRFHTEDDLRLFFLKYKQIFVHCASREEEKTQFTPSNIFFTVVVTCLLRIIHKTFIITFFLYLILSDNKQ